MKVYLKENGEEWEVLESHNDYYKARRDLKELWIKKSKTTKNNKKLWMKIKKYFM